ncbi:uncharacterized protein LOC127875286 isoform X2 [Dreissena polymorpha]|uniref:uncharacterized protein LOC127875286 isoform X2 n=1 Tax=Dreissena polymorpha TaxID=45954 RepID=UPI0022640267|nr:uncharacterized protein LOC127875286 isoform X2 [Dreissena polymorpha]
MLRDTEPLATESIIGDGNCFFRSLSYIITGSESQHFQVRKAVCAHMHVIPIQKVMHSPCQIHEYLMTSKMEQIGQWATEVEIFAAANLLQSNIYMYTKVGVNWKWAEFKHDYLQRTSVGLPNVAIYIKHRNTNHFEPVMSVQQNSLSLTGTDLLQKEILRQLQLSEAKAKNSSNSAVVREKDRERKQKKRQSAEYKQTENIRKKNSSENREHEKIHKRVKRQSDEYKKSESTRKKNSSNNREHEKIQMRVKRQSDEYKKSESTRKRNSSKNREHEKIQMRVKRQSDEYKKRESTRKRNSSKNREHEKIQMRVKRQSDEYKKRESTRKRNSSKNREHEKIQMRVKRQSDEYKKRESTRKRNSSKNREHEKIQMRVKRQSDEYKKRESTRKRNSSKNREHEKIQMRVKRQSDEYKKSESTRKRNSSENREHEKINKKRQRVDANFKEQETKRKKYNMEKNMINNFHKKVRSGPNFICTICDQLWYKNNVTSLSTVKKGNDILKDSCLMEIKSSNGKVYICSTCKSHVSNNRIPPLSRQNGVFFENLPQELDLTQLEERLVAARIPFMQMRELPRGGQVSITGNVVNVPTDVNKTARILPRRQCDDECIPIKLKRRLGYKQHYLYEYVRPNKVIGAIKWLTEHSILYQQEGIIIDEEWEQHLKSGTDVNPIELVETGTMEYSVKHHKTDSDLSLEEQQSNDDLEYERLEGVFDKDPLDGASAGPLDTLLQAQNIMEETRDILSVAPGEGSSPLSIFLDKHAESLSFPSLYCGKEMKSENDYDVKVHYTDLCKSELRRTDRRVAGHIPNLFFKLKKVQMKHILDKANICLRKTCGKQQNLTAGFLKSRDNLNTIIHTDLGFRVFKELRGSPPYWEKVKKDLFALIRYLGIPTWFASFSSADTRWTHLLQILGETVDKKKYSKEEVHQFSWFKKQELVKKDPVTCARHFDYQVRTFINTVLNNSSHPVGEIQDFFYKVEFQMRGSPHIHMLVWVKDAPKYEENKEEDVLHFIRKYVTCAKSEELVDLINLQTHSHSRTCKKNNKPICRFNFPLPPMDETIILQPLQCEVGEDEQKHKHSWDKISEFLHKPKPEDHDLDFNQFLTLLNMNKEDYLKAVRSSLSSPRVFLKRSLSETRINNYNPILLKCWRANMDLQYVIDAYSCAMYIISYIAKSQRGMSNLLYHAAKEAREGNNDIRQQVKFIGNKFLNNVEISAQEAVFTLLQIPLYKATRDVIFINTSPVEKRTVMLKDFSTIENLPDDSDDVIAEGILQQYSRRPPQLDTLCLADYVSKYKRIRQTSATKRKQTFMDYNSDENDQPYDENCKQFYELGNGYKLVRRQKQVCIRYVRFHPDKDSENYYRESLMLFYPWRCEDELIGLSQSYCEQFQVLTNINDTITEKIKEYNHKTKEIDEAVEKLQEIDEDVLQEQWNQVAPNTQHVEEECALLEVDPLFASLDPEDSSPEAVELNVGLGVQGGAGVGKTALTHAVYQMLLRYLNKEPGANPDDLKVLLGAPTGKAAFLIGGNTLHHIFQIPASQGFQYKKLSNEKRNSLRCSFKSVRVLIIDECSMVGNNMFNFINLRLQEIMGNIKDFGGLSVIAVGDFYQLKPVFDDWIFNNLKDDYGPLARNLWKDLFEVFCLTQIMRQKDDAPYAELLNRLRTGDHNNEDISILKTRVIGTSYLTNEYPTNTTHIFMTNEKVDAHNDLVYTLASQTDKIRLTAWDVVIGDVAENVKDEIIQKIPNKLSKTMGLSKTLSISLQSRVELSTNVDVDDGLANGASGQVMGLTHSKISHKGIIVWVKFENDKIGIKTRQSHLHLYTQKIPNSWTPVEEIKRQFPVGKYRNAEVLRTQIPLRPASAKTAHRCQGDTMEAAVVDFEGRSRCHCHYVALSRVKSLNQVFIRTLNEGKICVSSSVKDEMNRLFLEKKLCHSLIFPTNIDEKNITVMFHNARSLHAHFLDIELDPNFNSADVNIFVETKLSKKDNIEDYMLTGYHLKRFDCSLSEFDSTRSPYGIAVYYKHCAYKIRNHMKIIPSQGVIESVTINLNPYNINVVCLYVSPKISRCETNYFLQDLLSPLSSSSIIILGDFNIDLKSNTPLETLSGFHQYITTPTTDYKSILDHIYSNLDDRILMTGVFDSYFSDHKPIWASFSPVDI